MTTPAEIRRQRIAEAEAIEATATVKHLWWMSFADPDISAQLPREQQRSGGHGFLGVCIVEAATPVGAMLASHRLGCNPGGQIQTTGPFSLDTWAPEWRNRILSRAEVESITESP